jgi:hypothetical protein
MTARDVQFRFLQLVVSAVADERLTIALLHWDGAQLRFAASLERLPQTLGPEIRTALRVTLDSLATEVVRAGDKPLEQLRVREGKSGTIHWSGVRRARTASSELHFARLAADLHLVTRSTCSSRRPAPRAALRGASPRNRSGG